MRHLFSSLALIGLAALGLSSWASADPLPGEGNLKFFQSPLSGAPNAGAGVYPVGAGYNPATDFARPFFGQDMTSVNNTAQNTTVLDDFSDFNPNPIVHVTWWGSYQGGNPGPAGAGLAAQAFLITFWTNNPSNPSTPSTLIGVDHVVPGTLSPQSSTYTETLQTTPNYPVGIPGGKPGDSDLYKYNAELNIPQQDAVFPNVEWIGIQALSSNPSLLWGWHDRDYGIFDPYANPNDGAPPVAGNNYHFMDDAVTTNGGPYTPLSYNTSFDGIGTSMDMAFALYTVPEPASICLIGLASFGLMARRPRRKVN